MDRRRIQYRVLAASGMGMGMGMNTPCNVEDDWWQSLTLQAQQEYLARHPQSGCNANRKPLAKYLEKAAKILPQSFHDTLDVKTGGAWKKSGRGLLIAANAIDSWEKKWGELKQDDPRMAAFLEFTFKMVAAAGLAYTLGM